MRDVEHRLGRILERDDDQDAVDALLAQTLDGDQHPLAIERGDADDAHEVPGGVCRALDREQRRGGPVERRVEAHHAERS